VRREDRVMTEAPQRDVGRSAHAPARRRPRRERWLIGLEAVTGSAGLAGGVLLAAAPDGSLLAADPRALASSPFVDWRMPGVLLAVVVGGGFLITAAWCWRRGRGAYALSIVAGVGLVVFEAVQWSLIGFQPLQAVFAVVGAIVIWLAATADAAPAAE
jgi:hypothetical protein